MSWPAAIICTLFVVLYTYLCGRDLFLALRDGKIETHQRHGADITEDFSEQPIGYAFSFVALVFRFFVSLGVLGWLIWYMFRKWV